MDLLTELTRLGFTEYEAKVYLALLQEYPATGYQISKESGVPRSMVYETLSRLHARGAALETVEERATLYRPLPPQVFLDRQEEEYRRLLKDLRAGLEEIYTAIPDDRVWSIHGRTTILAYAAQLMRTAQADLFLVLTDDALAELRDEVLAACGRGLKVSTLLTGADELACGQVAYHPPLESELQGLTGTLLVVVEGGEVLVANTHRHEIRATVTSNTDLVLIARQFVWMELFTQRIYARLGPDLLARLDPEDREIFASLGGQGQAG